MCILIRFHKDPKMAAQTADHGERRWRNSLITKIQKAYANLCPKERPSSVEKLYTLDFGRESSELDLSEESGVIFVAGKVAGGGGRFRRRARVS